MKPLSNKAVIIGKGKECPKCRKPMERRKHPPHYISRKTYFYTEWDYCPKCPHVQHYEEFKSQPWQEAEYQEIFMRNLSNEISQRPTQP